MRIYEKLQHALSNKYPVNIVLKTGFNIILDFQDGQTMNIGIQDNVICIYNLNNEEDIIDDLYLRLEDICMVLDSRDNQCSIVRW